MWINQNRSSLNRVIMIKICWILKEIAKVELTLNSKNREGSDILAQSGGVEFLVKFNKFLKGKNMNEIISMNEDIIQTVVDFKSNELKYQPIKEEMKKDKANQEYEKNKKNRKNFRRPQPAIDENIKERSKQDEKKTKVSYEILRNEKNKVDMIKSKVESAEIFQNLEREEFIFLPEVQITERDQKLLFDLGVQLKFGKRAALLQCLLKEFPHFVLDFPIEALFSRTDIIDQLIVFGNCNDGEIKQAIIPTYRIILKKLNEKLKQLEDINYRNVCSSKTAANRVKLIEGNYLRCCYPSLDSKDYTSENFKMLQKEKVSRFYSFLPLSDALLKNIINLCTDNHLIGDFAELWSFYCLPLLTKLKKFNPEIVKRMVITYLNTLGRLLKHSPLEKLELSEVILIAPIFKISLELLCLYEYEEWKKDELYIIRNFLTQANRGIYIYMFDEEELMYLLTIMEKAERKEVELYKHINRVVGSIDSLRKLESFLKNQKISLGGNFKISDYKLLHKKLLDSVEAIEYTEDPNIVKFYVDNHLKSIALTGKCAAYAQKNDVHFEESKYLLERIMQLPSTKIKKTLLLDLLDKFNSSFSIKIGSSQDMYKNLVFELFRDSSLRTKILLNSINSTGAVKNLGYELLLTFFKKDYYHRKDSKFDISDFLPYILNDEHVNSKAKVLLEEIKSIDSRILINTIFTDLFSSSQEKRTLAYSTLFRHDLFDKCLRFRPKGDKSYNDRRLYQLFNDNIPKVPFNDPLENIYNQSTNKMTYLGKLNVFENSEKKLQRLGQSQIKELYDLLNIAVNEGLDFGVRISALQQINEVFFFYRKSVTLKDFAVCALNFSIENIESYGRKRETFRLELEKNNENLDDIQVELCKNFANELEIVLRFTAIFNNIMANYGFIDEIKLRYFIDIAESNNGMFKLRTFWSLATDPKLERKYQGLMALNLIYLNSLKLEKNLKTTLKFDKKKGMRTDSRVSKNYVVLFRNQDIEYKEEENAVKDFDERIVNSCKIDFFIETYLEQWQKISKESEENSKIGLDNFQGRMLSIIKRSLLKDSFELELEDLSNLMLKGDDCLSSLKLLLGWHSTSKIALLMNYTHFFSRKVSSLFKKIFTDSLINFPSQQQFILGADTLINLLNSSSFKINFKVDSNLKNFVKEFSEFYASTIVSYLEELNLGHVKENMSIITSILGMIESVCSLVEKSKETKLRSLIRKKIFRGSFLKKLEDITRIIESSDAFSTQIIKFVSKAVDMFDKEVFQDHYIPIVSYLFDSLLVAKNDDNFLGSHQIMLLLQLAHQLIVKNRFRLANALSSGERKRIDSVKNNLKNSSLKTRILKSTTVGWIVRLTTCRITEIRMLSWNVLTCYIDGHTLEMFPSLIDGAIQLVNDTVEAVGVQALGFGFLTKIAGILRKFGSVGRCDDVNEGVINIKYFIRVIFDRGVISRIKALLDSGISYSTLEINSIRFLIAFGTLDLEQIYPVYNNHNLPQIITKQMEALHGENKCIEEIKLRVNDSSLVKETTSAFFKVSLCSGFLFFATTYIKELGNFLIQCTPLIQRILHWLRIGSLFKKKPEGDILKIREDYRKAACLEMLKNISTLFENLLVNNKFEIAVKLNKIFEENGLNVFEFLAGVIDEQRNDDLSKKLLKLVSRILLTWKKGYKILDSGLGSHNPEIFVSEAKNFLKKFEYKKLIGEMYSDIVDYEEMLHILAMLISRSQKMKNFFISSKCFSLYIEKFNQILKIRDLDFVELESKNSIKEKKNVKRGRSFFKGGKSCCGKKEPNLKKGVELYQTMGTTMKSNVHQAIINETGHLQSYLLVLKALFYNTPDQKKSQKVDEKTKSKRNIIISEKFEASSKMLLSVIETIWLLGRKDPELLDDTLEILINWHMNPQFNKLLFSKLIEKKYLILKEILDTIIKLNVKEEFFEKYMKFVCCLLNRKEIRNQIYKTKLIENLTKEMREIWRVDHDFGIHNKSLSAILGFLYPLSFNEDSHKKIITSPELIDVCVDLLTNFMKIKTKNKQVRDAEKDVSSMLANIAASRSQKVFFKERPQILNIFLSQLTSPSSSLKLKAITSQFFTNLFFKNTSPLPKLNKTVIFEELKILKDEVETDIDKLTFGDVDDTKNMALEVYDTIEDKEEKLKLLKILSNNLRIVISILTLKIR